MEKPILATTLAGLFVKKDAWDKAHVLWYQEAARKLNDDSVLQWALTARTILKAWMK